MKKYLLFLVLLQIIVITAFGQTGRHPILKNSLQNNITDEQIINAVKLGDPDRIFNCTTEKLKEHWKEVLNWNIANKGWTYNGKPCTPIVTDEELFISMKTVLSNTKAAVFNTGERWISYVDDNGDIQWGDYRGNYGKEQAGGYQGTDMISKLCLNCFIDKSFLQGGSVVTPDLGTVSASPPGQPIVINNYIYAGNNNGNGNGGNASAVALNVPAEEKAVDASAPAYIPPVAPAPKYEPVYEHPTKVVYVEKGPTETTTKDCPECKKASPWGYVLAAGAGVAAGYILKTVLGGGSSSSGGTYYGGPTGGPVDVNGGTPIGPGGPVDIPGGPVDVGGGLPQ